MTIKMLLGAGIVALMAITSTAKAECAVKTVPFFMHLGDLTAHFITTDSNGCELNFATDGKTKFKSATIVANPKNGRLQKTAGLEFAYHPRPGFKGKDSFTMKLCGSSPAGSGCSTLNYEAEVQ